MKTIFLKTTTTMLLCVAMLCACSDGKDGTDGAQGPAGPAGPKGVDGNAGVKMYVWNNVSIPIPDATASFLIPNITTAEERNRHQITAYYSGPNHLIQVPHPVLWGCSVTSVITINATGCWYTINLFNANGTPYSYSSTWQSFRIVVIPIPAGNITEVKGASAVDFNNYAEVAKYYGLPE
jgi:hypothetical protein